MRYKCLYNNVFMTLIIHYLLWTIHYLQFTIHYLHCRSFQRMKLKASFHLQNQPWICWFSVLKFLAPKRNYWCYSRLHALIHERNVLYMQRVYMHIPPGRRSVSGTWGSLEATVSMAHASRRRGDPWSGSGAGLGEAVIPRNIKTPESICSTLGFADLLPCFLMQFLH